MTEIQIPISSVRDYLVCKRQWLLNYLERSVNVNNYYLTLGSIYHDATDQKLRVEKKKDKYITHATPLNCEALNINGIADIIEFHYDDNGVVIKQYSKKKVLPIPVELKSGRSTSKPIEHDMVQLVLQAMCIEEMYKVNIPYGYIYYKQSNKKHTVEFTASLRAKAINCVNEILELLKEPLSISLDDSGTVNGNCQKCSCKEICELIKKRKSGKSYMKRMVDKDEDSTEYIVY